MLSVDRITHVIRHVMTPRVLGALKSCAFGETLKMCLIDTIP